MEELERIFGFRTSETTNVTHYLGRMDSMGKFDSAKQNELLGTIIEHLIEIENKLVIDIEPIHTSDLEPKLELLAKEVSELEIPSKQDITTMKADITRIKKKVYPNK